MSLKIEKYLSEVQYAGGINSDLPIVTTSTITASNIVTSATGTAGSFAVNGDLSVTATATVSGNAVVGSGKLQVGSAGPTIYVGSAGPTTGPSQASVTGSLFINTGGTGPASRLYISTGSAASSWTSITTAA